ncbi:MAG TPA: hypothetical protein VFA70_01960 [Dehalococcoidia bacterium]|jgi:uncharacterized ferritin-like protein (DUF455 family)|nr:hypothetical protein [Dehalococcoidia bacterium]
MVQASRLSEQVANSASLREPPYRPAMTLTPQEREELAKKLGDAANYEGQILRELVEADPANVEFKKALVSSIASAEFAGIDAFSRKVVQWQDWDVPPELILAMARQTWDEVRHAQLAIGLLESYGGTIGEYPDTLAGGGGQRGPMMKEMLGDDPADPLISLETTNVSLEGGALTMFQNVSKLGRRIGDHLMEHCYDYNWADEVTHTAIGDYFVKALCDGDPEKEQRALRAHARYDEMRNRLSGEQQDEIREFFAEETERATAALA